MQDPAPPFPSDFRIVDLSHPLDEAMPCWPGDTPLSLRNDFDGPLDLRAPQDDEPASHPPSDDPGHATPAADQTGDSGGRSGLLPPGGATPPPPGLETYYFLNTLCMSEHAGTHVDAPRHMRRDGPTVDRIPLDRLAGPGVCVDASARLLDQPDGCVELLDLLDWESRNGPIPCGAIVLLHTGHSRHWSDPVRYYGAEGALRFPGLAPDAARFLVDDRGARAVGIDTPGVDPGRSHTYETHKALFARDVPAVENLTGLDRLPPVGFFVLALPLAIRGGSGAPARVVALLPG